MSNGKEVNLIVGIDEKIPIPRAIVLGVQHILAMDLYVMPSILALLLSLDITTKSLLIQTLFIASGIATIIQTSWGIKLPVIQGPSYAPLGALAAIGGKVGLAGMIGSLIPGAILLTIFGKPLKVFSKFIQKCVPPVVAGTVILVVGIALMPVAFEGIFAYEPGNLQALSNNVITGAVTAILMVAFVMIGIRFDKGFGRYIRISSVILSIVCGTILASFLNGVDFSSVSSAPWLALPALFPFGMPTFDLNAILIMCFIYFIVLIETTGTWFTVGAVTGVELDEERLNGGAAGEGIGCLVGTLFGGTPLTGYSVNAGVISLTGVASRMAIIAGGVILILLGMIPKLMNIIACIPGPVISGVFSIVAVVVAMNGFRVVKQAEIDERNIMVIGIPILLALSCSFIPKDFLYSLPSLLSYLFSSGIAVGALSALVMNLAIPLEKNDKSITHNNKEVVN